MAQNAHWCTTAVPEVQRSAFRETVEVLAVSAASLFVTGLLFTAGRTVWPNHTPNIRGLVREPKRYFLDHHVHITWWTTAFLTTATILAWLAADPRLPNSRLMNRARRSKLCRVLTGSPAPIKQSSAWHIAAHLYDHDPGLIHIGAQLDDGTYVVGYLDHYNIDTRETPDRDILLHGPLGLITKDGKKHNLKSTFTIISVGRIIRLDLTHLAPSVKPIRQFPAEENEPANIDQEPD